MSLFTTAFPAHAEAGHKAYPKGDAPASIDIAKISATNGVERVMIRAKVPGLRTAGTILFTVDNKYDGITSRSIVRPHAACAARRF